MTHHQVKGGAGVQCVCVCMYVCMCVQVCDMVCNRTSIGRNTESAMRDKTMAKKGVNRTGQTLGQSARAESARPTPTGQTYSKKS